MRQLLEWVLLRPRTYDQAMEAWQSHCPRYTEWEDALELGLIELGPAPRPGQSSSVRLTPGGQAILAQP
jgi:hypothetical protein